MSRSWAKGSTRQWRAVRARVLEENRRGPYKGGCNLGVPGVCTGGEATHVHHVLGRAVTGDDPRYLVATCAACNLHVGEPAKSSPKPRKVSNWSSRSATLARVGDDTAPAGERSKVRRSGPG